MNIIIFYFFITILLYTEVNYKTKINLLFFVASFGTNQLKLLYKMIKQFVIICESGYRIKVIIHHTDIINNSYFKNFYCFNDDSFIDFILIKIPPTIGHYLVKEHRKYIIENRKIIKRYNHIGFFENDIEFTLSNLKYYFYTLSLIKKYNIQHSIPGFKRYELSKCNNGDIWKSCQDHIEYAKLILIENELFVRIKEGYSAMWLMPIEYLIPHIFDDNFINIPDNVHIGNIRLKEWYTYNSWEKHYLPLIPLNKMDDCFVHHLSNKYIHYYKTIQISELYYQMNICISDNGINYKGEVRNKVIYINHKIINRNSCVSLPKC